MAILAGTWTPEHGLCENHDLWHEIAALLADQPAGLFMAQWTPSHLDHTLCADEWEEWLAI